VRAARGGSPTRYALSYWMTNYRRTWRGTALSGVLEPIAFLAAMGLGLGAIVDDNGGGQSLGGTSYLMFLAPGLMAATAIQTAMFESTYPVLGAIKWQRTYYAQLATALRVSDALRGHLTFVAFRIATMAAVFLVVMAVFGAVDSPWAIFMIPVSLLVGLAVATPVFAFAARQQTDSGFAMLFRFGLTPMFLFSGTFFPISQLPDLVEPLALLSPLWHGVELSRGLALGGLGAIPALGHVGYLLLWVVGGYLLALRSFTKRLVL
jgi:lipooligosaccharide transport system permease protein